MRSVENEEKKKKGEKKKERETEMADVEYEVGGNSRCGCE